MTETESGQPVEWMLVKLPMPRVQIVYNINKLNIIGVFTEDQVERGIEEYKTFMQTSFLSEKDYESWLSETNFWSEEFIINKMKWAD